MEAKRVLVSGKKSAGSIRQSATSQKAIRARFAMPDVTCWSRAGCTRVNAYTTAQQTRGRDEPAEATPTSPPSALQEREGPIDDGRRTRSHATPRGVGRCLAVPRLRVDCR